MVESSSQKNKKVKLATNFQINDREAANHVIHNVLLLYILCSHTYSTLCIFKFIHCTVFVLLVLLFTVSVYKCEVALATRYLLCCYTIELHYLLYCFLCMVNSFIQTVL